MRTYPRVPEMCNAAEVAVLHPHALQGAVALLMHTMTGRAGDDHGHCAVRVCRGSTGERVEVDRARGRGEMVDLAGRLDHFDAVEDWCWEEMCVSWDVR